MDKKNIDELFQQKFENFKETPDEKVWTGITAALDKKRKKRMIPIWWQLGGIAAALLIGFILLNPFINTITTDTNITDTEHVESPTEMKATGTKDTKITTNSDQVKNDEIIPEKNEKLVNTERNNKTNTVVLNQRSVVSNSTKNSAQSNNASSLTQVKEDFKKQGSGIDIINNRDDQNKKSTEEIAAYQFQESHTNRKNEDSETSQNTTLNLSENSSIEKNKALETAITSNQKEEEINPNKKSIFEEIEETDKELVAENKGKRWSAGPSIAPVYFNAIGEGSPVHSSFVPNSKSGNVNLSYGLSLAYEINPKLTVRSGVHKVDYGYDTNNVSFSTSLSAINNGQISTIDYTSTSKNLVVTSKESPNSALAATNKSIDFLAQNPQKDGIMSQQLGYIEVPMELNYTVIDNKFGLNIIGGLSSLFLIDNAVALTSGDLTTEMGEANNVNDLNFSANFGLGVNYKFSQKVRLNIEPVFKYQLNTFSQTQGTFNPYSLGVYSGLSFRF